MTDNTYEVPYWVDSHVEVRALRIGEISASMFNNDTEYRLRLVGLSFAGPITPTTPAITTLPTRHPGWASNLLVDIGKSGCSDQTAGFSPDAIAYGYSCRLLVGLTAFCRCR